MSINRLRQFRYFRFSSAVAKQSLLVLFLAIGLWVYQVTTSSGVLQVTTLNRSDPIDASIYKLRTSDLTIKVLNQQQKPIANATVQVEQIAHEFPFGTTLSTEMFQPTVHQIQQTQYLNLTKQLFNTSVHENALKWYSTEPVRGQVNYRDADRILEWSERNRLKMRGHTLFWALEKWNQPWVQKLNAQELLDAVRQRTLEICQRYKGRFTDYDVINEPLHGNFYPERLGKEIVGNMFRWCHLVDASAGLYVNEYDILNGKSLNPYIEYIRNLLRQGVPISGIGVQGHIRENITADRIQASLDALARLGLPIKITEFDAVANTEQEQARILKDVYRIAFAHPAVTGILMWGFWQGAHWEPQAAIFKQNFEPKLAAIQYQQLVYRDWWTRVRSTTSPTGVVSVRAFFGHYRVTITTKNQTFQQTIDFSSRKKPSETITITVL